MVSHITTLSLSKIAPALAVIDPLVPQLPEGSPARSSESDLYGYSSFARLATAVSLILSSDRFLLRSSPIWIRVISTYNLFASDELALPGSSKHVFGAEIARGELEAIVKTGDALRSYALSSTAGSLEVGWHQASIAAVASGKLEGKDGVCTLLGELVEAAREGEDIYASRVLRDLLAGVLQYSGAGVAEAEAWLMFGRTLQDKGESFSSLRLLRRRDEADSILVPVPPSSLQLPKSPSPSSTPPRISASNLLEWIDSRTNWPPISLDSKPQPSTPKDFDTFDSSPLPLLPPTRRPSSSLNDERSCSCRPFRSG